jgi:hypothetical protein
MTDRSMLVDQLLPQVERVYPEWQGFDDPRFRSEERVPKEAAVALAQKLLDPRALQRLLISGDHREIVERARKVARQARVLYRATPSTSNLAPLESQGLADEQRAELVIDLLHGTGSTAERLDRYRGRVSAAGLPASWPLPTYLLFLFAPQEEIFIRPSVVRWLTKRTEDVTYTPRIDGAIYEGILGLYREIGDQLLRRGYGVQDFVDIQSFVWVAYLGERRAQAPQEGAIEDDADDQFGPESATATVPIHPDVPALVDELERRPFAEILALRIRQSFTAAAAAGAASAFAVHLHGPWGSGKTSVLNFLEEELRRGETPWVVVRFDAWKHQRIRPPWWPLIRAVADQAPRQLPPEGRRALRWTWWRWRLRTSWLPIALTLLTMVLTVLFLFLIVDTSTPGSPFSVGEGLALLVTVLGVGGSLYTLHRSLLFGSAKAAQAYVELESDPLGPLTRLFSRLVGSCGRPLALFIDDLDRCDADVVVDLLEGIQTLFREAPVTYVVAADREWIRTSFERRYAGFLFSVGEPGRPLGHLFLEKMFQVSLPVPRLTQQARLSYWRRLLVSGEARTVEEARESHVEEATRRLGDATSPEDIQHVVELHRGDQLEGEVRVAAAERLSTPRGIAETEHFLAQYAPLLEANPRAMKRLVTAFGLQHAVNLLSHLDVPLPALAAWTILEQRWPQLASLLIGHPDLFDALAAGASPPDERIPEPLRQLFGHPQVLGVLRGVSLTPALDGPAFLLLSGEGRVETVPAGEDAPTA